MTEYNLLHARNELAHNNQVILQASGTLCLSILHTNASGMENLLSTMRTIAGKHCLNFVHLALEKGNSEEVHQYLLNSNLENVDYLLLTFSTKFESPLFDDFIGQDHTFSLIDQMLDLPKGGLSFNLKSPEGLINWETWLLENHAPQEVEYYEPGID